MNWDGLQGKRILITGGSSGLGQACAALLNSVGASLVLPGRRPDLLKQHFSGDRHTIVEADLAQDEALETVVDAVKQGGPVDGVVLAAGVQEIKPLMMETEASLRKTWDINVNGSLLVLARLLKTRLIAKGASIVFLSSAAAHAGGPGLVSYAASKGALEAAVRSLALELAPQGIRVNAVSPGVVETPMSAKYMTRMTAAQIEGLRQQHPLGFGRPEDVAAPVAFLLSGGARWITGTTIMVDGGLSSH